MQRLLTPLYYPHRRSGTRVLGQGTLVNAALLLSFEGMRKPALYGSGQTVSYNVAISRLRITLLRRRNNKVKEIIILVY